MRRPVALLVVALLCLSLAGCGGGGDDQAAQEGAQQAAPPPASAAANEDAVAVTDRSAEETAVFEPFPTVEGAPEAVTSRLESQQPMLLFFFDGAQRDTNDTRGEIDAVVKENTGAIDLIAYDVGKYTSVDASGAVKVDEKKLAEDESNKQAITLARTLGVTGTPFIVIVDDQGMIIHKHRGFIDRDLLDRQVQRVSD